MCTMAVEIEEIYSDLNKLLADICQFLTDKTNYEKLSPSSQKHADLLLKRSKKQLVAIEKISRRHDEGEEPYVDMDPKQVTKDDDIWIYSSAEETKIIQDDPYSELPAKQLCLNVKFGNLLWKKRWWIPIYSKVFAGIHNNWLIVYGSEKDSKPIQTFDLKIYKSDAATKTKNQFELFRTIDNEKDKKSQYFIGETPKDVHQWVSRINQINEGIIPRMPPDSEESLEIYECIPEKLNDINTNHQELDEGDETDYDSVGSTRHNPVDTKLEVPKIPPDLPKRKLSPLSKSQVPLPPIPPPATAPMKDSRQSVESTISYDSVKANSFSESDSDDIYDEVAQLKTKIPIARNVPITGTATETKNVALKKHDDDSFSESESDEQIYEFYCKENKSNISNKPSSSNSGPPVPKKPERSNSIKFTTFGINPQ